MENNRRCEECKYARKACNKQVIFCSHWYNKHGNDAQSIMKDSLLDTVYSGWGYPNRSPHGESSGTCSEGLIWNDVILIDKDNSCFKYEKGGN